MSVFAHERMRVGEPWFSRIDTILDLFLYNGANLNDISIAPSEGQSCLFRAINGIGLDSYAANVNFIRKLLSLEAEVNIGYVKGDDNLVYDDNFLVEWENGDSVTYVRGDTPLHAAVCIGRLYIVKLLLEYYADMNIKNRLGHTPLDYAIIYEHDKIQKAMILYTRKKRYDYS
jgi:ankyrin repeat protein